jgi:hypothetical protein
MGKRIPGAWTIYLVVVTATAFGVAPGAAFSQIFVTRYVTSTNKNIGQYTTTGATINAALVTGLSGPEGITVSEGYLFVVNKLAGTIGKYTTSGATVNASLITGLSSPVGIAVSGEDLYVANSSTGTIGKYTTSGGTVNAALITGLDAPTGIAVDGDDLFVTTQGATNSIGTYTTSGTTLNASFVSGLDIPQDIAVYGGSLFVTNFGDGRIGEYDATSGATINAALISNGAPYGIDAFEGNLYVTFPASRVIAKYTTEGAIVDSALVSFITVPRGIVVVPEPWTLGMLAAGAPALVTGRRQRRPARKW